MRIHEFKLILARTPTEAKADRFYGVCNDGTLLVTEGVAQVQFHRKAKSLEAALRSALADVRAVGLKTLRVEMEPDAVQVPA
jgi:hypothetical protein